MAKHSPGRHTDAEWRTARRLYAIYSAVISHFDIGVPPCSDLESPIDRDESSARARVRSWLSLMDERCPVAYLRQVLQTNLIATEENLRAILQRYLRRTPKEEGDRDKVDFLLVHYFSHCASEVQTGELTLAQVGRILEPVLGPWTPETPEWLKELDTLVAEAGQCRQMSDLEERRILERGRDLKVKSGIKFFEPPALIAFTRYNIVLRRTFFHAMRTDLEIVRQNVTRLEKLGVRCIDASLAGLSERESLGSLRRICLEWRTIFRSDYSSGHVFRCIKELRAATDRALAEALQKKTDEAYRTAISDPGLPDTPASAAPPRLASHRHISSQVIPENTLELAYPELAVEVDPVGGTPVRFRLPEVINHIAQQLRRARLDRRGFRPFAAILNDTAVRLSTWEAKAFFADPAPVVAAIRNSVGARLILQEAFDGFQEGDRRQLPAALAVAHGEAGRMQELIAESRESRKSDQALYLAATAQRLLSLMEEAEYALCLQEENS